MNRTDTIAHTPYLQQLEKDMVFIEGDTFSMGSEKYRSEKPIHKVTVSNFHLCKYPVTQALWESVMGENPSYFKGANRPVEYVSWDDVQIFMEKLNKISGKSYRLPSEAEWEYAARGGKHTLPQASLPLRSLPRRVGGQSGAYAGSNKLKEVGWYEQNSHGETKPVGLKLPNELGLYDMNGNVWERCADVWRLNYDHAPADGSACRAGGGSGSRVIRGGSWRSMGYECHVSTRNRLKPVDRYNDIGFRLAR